MYNILFTLFIFMYGSVPKVAPPTARVDSRVTKCSCRTVPEFASYREQKHRTAVIKVTEIDFI